MLAAFPWLGGELVKGECSPIVARPEGGPTWNRVQRTPQQVGFKRTEPIPTIPVFFRKRRCSRATIGSRILLRCDANSRWGESRSYLNSLKEAPDWKI